MGKTHQKWEVGGTRGGLGESLPWGSTSLHQKTGKRPLRTGERAIRTCKIITSIQYTLKEKIKSF